MSRFMLIAAHPYLATRDEEDLIDPEMIIEMIASSMLPLSKQVERIEDHDLPIHSHVRNDGKIVRLSRDIYFSLPVHSTSNGLPVLDTVTQCLNTTDLDIAQVTSTPEVWSQYYDEDIADVRRAFARLLEYYPDVAYVRDSVGDTDSHIPIHDDIDIAYSPSLTDAITGGTDRTSSGKRDRATVNLRTVRRYYKTSGDKLCRLDTRKSRSVEQRYSNIFSSS